MYKIIKVWRLFYTFITSALSWEGSYYILISLFHDICISTIQSHSKKRKKKNVYTKQQWSLWCLTASLLRHLWNVIMHQYHWTITIPSEWSSSWRNNEQPDRYFLETYPFQLTMPCNHSMEHHSDLNVSLIITRGSHCVHVSCLLMTIALITAVCCYPLNQPLKSNNVAG